MSVVEGIKTRVVKDIFPQLSIHKLLTLLEVVRIQVTIVIRKEAIRVRMVSFEVPRWLEARMNLDNLAQMIERYQHNFGLCAHSYFMKCFGVKGG